MEGMLCYLCVEVVQWSCRVLSSLWRRGKMSLCAAKQDQPPPTWRLVSIKMAPSSGPNPQVTWPSTTFPSLMKASTSVTPALTECLDPAGSLSQVMRLPFLFFFSGFLSSGYSTTQVWFSAQVTLQMQPRPLHRPRPPPTSWPDWSFIWLCSFRTASPLSWWCLYIETGPQVTLNNPLTSQSII